MSYGDVYTVMAATTASLSTRQVVLIGLSGSGKSTIANELFTKPLFNNSDAGAAIRRKAANIRGSDVFLDVTIIRAITISDQEHTKEYYRDLMPDEVSLVLFVCKYPTINEDLQSLKRVVGYFDGRNGRDACALVVTFCDTLSDDERKLEEETFVRSPEKACVGNRVKATYCVSFKPEDSMNRGGLSDSRKKLWDIILQSKLVYPKQSIFSDRNIRQKIPCNCSIL